MVAATFPTALKFVLSEEGGWSNDPHDPGGQTNHGITLRTLQSFHHGATADDLRHIPEATVATIYRRQYWSIMGCDNLPAGVDLMVFDFGTNAGPHRSVTYLQIVAGVKRDGIDGAITEAAVAKMNPSDVIPRLNGLQLAHYRALPTYDRFGEGWENRSVRRVKAALLASVAAAPTSGAKS